MEEQDFQQFSEQEVNEEMETGGVERPEEYVEELVMPVGR